MSDDWSVGWPWDWDPRDIDIPSHIPSPKEVKQAAWVLVKATSPAAAIADYLYNEGTQKWEKIEQAGEDIIEETGKAISKGLIILAIVAAIILFKWKG